MPTLITVLASTALINAALGLFVYLTKPGRIQNRYFFLLTLNCSLWAIAIGCVIASQEGCGRETAKPDMGVRNGDRFAAVSIADRARLCSGTSRSDPKRATGVHPRDRAAPRTHGVNVQRRNA